jgi:acyl-CoA thioester hydrolase
MKKFEIPIQIRFKDIDAMGHVNNAVYFSFFEVGRLEFFMKILKAKSTEDFPFILAKTEASFLIPIDLTCKNVILRLWAGDFGKKSFKFFYELVEKDKPVKYAEGESIQVFFDYKSKRTIPVPETFKEKIKDFIQE